MTRDEAITESVKAIIRKRFDSHMIVYKGNYSVICNRLWGTDALIMSAESVRETQAQYKRILNSGEALDALEGGR